MMNLVSLLAAILVSLQYTLVAGAQDNNALDNNLQPNVVPMPRRRLRSMVRISDGPPSNVQLKLGTKLVLKCEVVGEPSPTVQWMKNGELVEDYVDENNDILPSVIGMLVSQLVITSATSGDVFTCVAKSGVKRDSASTTVFVVEGNDEDNLLTLQTFFEKPSKPIITTYYNDVFQNIGSDIVLPCRVNSDSKTQLYWQDNNEKIVYGDSRIQVLPSGDLLLKSLRWSDMGNFTCMVKNMYGKDYITSFIYPLKVK